jgi:hypothetical protein
MSDFIVDFIVGFTAGWFVIVGLRALIDVIGRKIGTVIRIGGEDDQPDYDTLEDLIEPRGDL